MNFTATMTILNNNYTNTFLSNPSTSVSIFIQKYKTFQNHFIWNTILWKLEFIQFHLVTNFIISIHDHSQNSKVYIKIFYLKDLQKGRNILK